MTLCVTNDAGHCVSGEAGTRSAPRGIPTQSVGTIMIAQELVYIDWRAVSIRIDNNNQERTHVIERQNPVHYRRQPRDRA